MSLTKNIKVGNLSKFLINLFFCIFFIQVSNAKSNDEFIGTSTDIKILDKISSKNILLKLENGVETRHKDLLIKIMKCKNSEFDDNPETLAYLQVKDLTKKSKDDVFIFNGWMFSSSPSIAPFDHPVYDIWLVNCY